MRLRVRSRIVLAAITFVALAAARPSANSFAGDDTDASIPGAKVVIRNDATNAEMVLTTDSSGLFRAPQLNPGTYTVTITNQGNAPVGQWRFGSLTWAGGPYTVRSPIAVAASSFSAPPVVAGTGRAADSDGRRDARSNYCRSESEQ